MREETEPLGDPVGRPDGQHGSRPLIRNRRFASHRRRCVRDGAVVGLFPVGPGLCAATAILILVTDAAAALVAAPPILIRATDGVAASAAAGALLTATAAVGALCFAGWALVDRLWLR